MTAFIFEALRREHRREAFRSGSAPFDRYLRDLALQDVKRRLAGCYVAVAEDGEIAGFYTLAATHVAMTALPADVARKLPRYDNVPAVLIGRLAVATNFQKQGLGGAMIVDAALRTEVLGVGAHTLVVDAKDAAAAAFYETSGFLPIPGEDRRMLLPLATVLKGLTTSR